MEGDVYYNTEETANWSGRLSSSQLCRICANPNGYLIPIFEGEGLDHELGMKIQKHLPIQVSAEDNLPKQMCYQCASTLISWHDLVISCLEADRKIRNLQKQEQEDEDEDDDAEDDKVIEAFDDPIKKSDTAGEEIIEPGTSLKLLSEVQTQSGVEKDQLTSNENHLENTEAKTVAVKCPSQVTSPQQEISKSPKSSEITNIQESTSQQELIPSERSLEHPSLSATMKNMEDHQDKQSSSNILLKETGTDCVSINIRIKEEAELKNITARVMPHCYSIFVRTDDDTEYHLCDMKEVENALQISEYSLPLSFNQLHTETSNNEDSSQSDLSEDPPVPTFTSELSDHNYVNMTSEVSSVMPSVVNFVQANDVSPAVNPEQDKSHETNGTCDLAVSPTEHLELTEGELNSENSSNGRMVSCKYCQKNFRCEAVLQTHIRTHTGTTPFYCKFCGRSFRLYVSLKQHLMECNEENDEFTHPLTKRHDNYFVCTLCGKKYKLKPSLKEHLRAHLGKARLKLKCEVCGQKFLKKADIFEHLKSHENLLFYSCEMCDKIFINERDLQDHNISHSDIRPFSCSVCGSSYKRKSHLTRHALSHADTRKRVRAPQIRRKPGEEFKCEVCGKISATKRLLMLHMISHSGERNYECSLCGKRFAQSGAMSRHVHTVHGGAKDFSCEICNQSFTAKATKENHMRIHTGEKPYMCVTCGKTFRTQQQHRVHEKIHSDARPYPCPFCAKCFRRRPHLVVHIRTHTGEKPYACPTCGRCFAQKNDMTKHMNIHNR